MSRKGNLIKNTAILSLGSFFTRFITVLITPILTAQLSKSDYGRYDLITTLVSLLLPILTVQISSSAFRFLIDKKNEEKDRKKIINTIFTFVTGVSIIVCLIFLLISHRELGINGVIICLYFYVDIMFVTIQQVIRGLEKNLLYSIGSLIYAVINVILITFLTGILGTHNWGLTGVLFALLVSKSISAIFLIIKGGILKDLNLKCIDYTLLKALLSYSWPMVPNNFSMGVLRLSDRLVITTFLGLDANAIYAVANKLPTIFSAFQGTFVLAWQENASTVVKDDDKDLYYSQMFESIHFLLTGIMAALIAATPLIWRFLIQGDYDTAYIQLPVLYLGMLFSSMSAILGGIYIAHMKTKNIGISTMIAAVVNLIMDLLLIKPFGIWAGSISTLTSYFLLFVYRMCDIQKFQKLKINISKFILSIVLLSVMGFLNSIQLLFFDVLNVFLCLLVLYIFDKTVIINLIKMVSHFFNERNKDNTYVNK